MTFKNREFCLKVIMLLFVANLVDGLRQTNDVSCFPASAAWRGGYARTRCSSRRKFPIRPLTASWPWKCRNRSDYPYRNLSLSVYCTLPGGIPLWPEYLHSLLWPAKRGMERQRLGQPLPDCISREQYRIETPGTYLFKEALYAARQHPAGNRGSRHQAVEIAEIPPFFVGRFPPV